MYVHERVIGDADDIQIANTQQNRIDEHANEGWIYGLYKTKHGPDLRVNAVGVADRGEYMNLQLNDTEYM